MVDLGATGYTTLPLGQICFNFMNRTPIRNLGSTTVLSLLQFECAAGVTYVLPLQAANFDLSHFVAEN